jgi:uncharacterized membrane protein (UPF0127 family)
MPTVATDKPNVSSTAFFFGSALILIMVGLIFAISGTVTTREIKFGSCILRTDVAHTDADKARGLSGKAMVPADYALLFPFYNEEPSFWMKGMQTSIDIVWVKNGHVAGINPNLPLDDGATAYDPPGPIDWVVEVAAGRTSQCNVTVGSPIDGLRY